VPSINNADQKRIDKLKKQIERARIVTAPENSLGQWIGYFLDRATHLVLEQALQSKVHAKHHPLELRPKEGGPLVRLLDDFGDQKQIDHAVFKNDVPKVIIESKWLKDKRHLNDKGAWIRQLEDIVTENSVNKALLVLAGPWDGYRDRMEKRNFGVIIIEVDHVYKTLKSNGIDISIDRSREAYVDPESTLNQLLDVIESRIAAGDTDPVGSIGLKILDHHRSEIERQLSIALTS
jgi:hypothetical protein